MISKAFCSSYIIPPPIKQDLDKADRFFTKNVSYLYSLVDYEKPIESKLPQVAFLGRSNVGKSSIVNALTYRKKMVFTSKKPGHTRALNFFSLAERVILVDMPGYGHRSRPEWGQMINNYFKNEVNLRRLFLLIDSKVGFKQSDLFMLDVFEEFKVPHQIVLTKCDKRSPDIIKKTAESIQKHYQANLNPCWFPQILETSSTKKQGISRLRSAILESCSIQL